MKYLLFINYNHGLKHNAVYDDLSILHDSILQLIYEEGLNSEYDYIPDLIKLKSHFIYEDDYSIVFSNNTWLHIQELTFRNNITAT